MALSPTAILTLADLRRYLKVAYATVAATPAPAVDGATLSPSANGFLEGMPVTLALSAGDQRVTITDVTSNAVTWSPALGAPPVADVVVYDSAADAMLEDIVNAVSAEFERETGRYVITRTGIVETVHGNGRAVMALRRRPVVQITALTIDGLTLTPGTDYVVDADTGLVTLKARTFTPGVANVVTTYDAGWAQASVPADIQSVIRRWCKFEYDQWHTGTVAAQTVTIGSQNFTINPDLPSPLRKAIARWVDHRIW